MRQQLSWFDVIADRHCVCYKHAGKVGHYADITPTQSRQAHKASSALYMIKQGLLRNRDFSIKPTTALKLFDAYIKSILLYNCEVWAPAGWRNSIACDPRVLNLINLDKT